MNKLRRRMLLGGLGLGAAGAALALTGRDHLWNPCLPADPADNPLTQAAWQGVDASKVWDCHAHLAGIGDGGSGIVISAEMNSLLHPLQYVQRLFYFNAACVHKSPPGQIDQTYVERLLALTKGMRPGFKMMLFAFDWVHDAAGQPLKQRSALHVPNSYARDLARRYPDSFEWVASIHPYRSDAVAALEQAKAEGCRAVKWLPPAMGIDPAASRCDAFYRALARLNLPLITHAGEEKAVHGVSQPELGNPLRLRRALDAGVRVVIAHCASTGEDDDLDHDGNKLSSFKLFSRMMDDPNYRANLYADISAISQRNRSPDVVRQLIEREDWHPRLLNGSDYPLPGVMPLFLPSKLAAAGLLDEAVVPGLFELQKHNPLLFDFVLKRHLSFKGKRFSHRIFETRSFFEPTTA